MSKWNNRKVISKPLPITAKMYEEIAKENLAVALILSYLKKQKGVENAKQ